jgi:hypothetical protein
MICPVCKLELGVERRADEVVTYSFEASGCRCRERGDPALCRHVLPTILTMLPEAEATPIRSMSCADWRYRGVLFNLSRTFPTLHQARP